MILAINVGRSSIKYKLFNGEKIEKSDSVDRIGQGKVLNHIQAWEKLYQGLATDVDQVKFVGHLLPYGGDKFHSISKLDQDALLTLREEVSKLTFYNTAGFDVAQMAMTIFPKAVHFGLFDNCFFQDLNKKFTLCPISQEISSKYSIFKHGAQGISHRYAIRKAQSELGMIRTQRAISVHLGDTCTITAMMEGQSVDTSAGFTPWQGLMGMTKAGDIDSGVIIYLLKNGMDLAEIEILLSEKAGVFGVSGVGDDMRDILYIAGYKVDDDNYVPSQNLPKGEKYIDDSRLAIDMFINKIIKYIGGYVGILGGLDTLIITGTIGVKSSEIRNLITSNLSFVKDYEVLVVEPNEEMEMKLMLEDFCKADAMAVVKDNKV